MTVQIASSSLLKLGIETEKDVKARESTYLLLDLVRNCSSHLLLGVVKPFSLKQDKNKNTNQSNKQINTCSRVFYEFNRPKPSETLKVSLYWREDCSPC